MNPYCVGALGLILDFVGACFVAYEVVLQYQGKKYRDIKSMHDINDTPLELPEYTAWEGRKYKFMLFGLFVLFLGCAVQLWGLWLGYKLSTPPQAQSSANDTTKTISQPVSETRNQALLSIPYATNS